MGITVTIAIIAITTTSKLNHSLQPTPFFRNVTRKFGVSLFAMEVK
jgi:hypothetical protein